MSNTKLEVITLEKKLLVDYDEMETVLQLKQKLYMDPDINVPPAKQRLYYFGTLLKDHKTLGSYKINPAEYLVVMVHDLRDKAGSSLNMARKTKHIRDDYNNDGASSSDPNKYFNSLLDFNNDLKQDQATQGDFNETSTKKFKSLSAAYAEIQNFEYQKNNNISEYCTFDAYKSDPLFLNLVEAMNIPSEGTNDVEEAVEKLIKVDHKVLDLIYENLGEFLTFCSEPKSIGDTCRKE